MSDIAGCDRRNRSDPVRRSMLPRPPADDQALGGLEAASMGAIETAAPQAALRLP